MSFQVELVTEGGSEAVAHFPQTASLQFNDYERHFVTKFKLETDVLIFVKKIGNCVERNETKLETFVIQKLQKFLFRVKRSHKIISQERKK